MLVGYDHQVAGCVRVDIQDDKIKLGTRDDEIFFVACRVVKDVTKNAAARFGRTAFCYVVIPPWTPKNVHGLRGRDLILIDQFL